MFEVIIMNLAQNICLDDFWVRFKLDHLGEKLGHQAKSKENLVNILEVTFLSNHHESCSKCLS